MTYWITAPNVRRRDAQLRAHPVGFVTPGLAAPVISTRLLRDRSSATGFWIEADLMANPQVIDDVKPALACARAKKSVTLTGETEFSVATRFGEQDNSKTITGQPCSNHVDRRFLTSNIRGRKQWLLLQSLRKWYRGQYSHLPDQHPESQLCQRL